MNRGCRKCCYSKNFHMWFLKTLKNYLFISLWDTGTPTVICFCCCGVNDTASFVHVPESGRWKETHHFTLLIYNVVFYVCVGVVKWRVNRSEPGRPPGKKIAFCSLWKLGVVWKSVIIPPVSSDLWELSFTVVHLYPSPTATTCQAKDQRLRFY